MAELKVVRWKKYGQDRVYVNLPDGTAVAWADARSGKVTVLLEEHRREALRLLRPHLATGTVPAPPPGQSPTSTPPAASKAKRAPRSALPVLTTPDDLALNRPGAELRGLLAAKGPTPVERIFARLLRRKTEWDSWFKGLAGERKVGAELERLAPLGWKVLHSIPQSRGGDIDHLLIGPGGVFTINTKNHQGKSVWIGDTMVKVDHGPPRPYVAKSRSEAQRVRAVLEGHCSFPVPVEPVLVFVGVKELPVVPTQLAVRVYREREVAALGPLTGKLSIEQIEAVYAVARHRRAWLGT
ncbi:nuclease-related domain-containing protein [Streptomyces sp. NPDC051109]|uniref:nuclease-related domain-containing protein n=1 Tax=Streptomyces sp. NPDC051109 TaxID=3365642 RepID=UPI0037A8B3BF